MQAYTTCQSQALVLERANIDTDLIIPARHLKTISRQGLGVGLFETLRYNKDGSVRADNIFDAPETQGRKILIAGENFGCGSSREHAVWALMDYGIRVVIAPSFADIFAGNALKNGLLTVVLGAEDHAEAVKHAEAGAVLSVALDVPQVSAEGWQAPFSPSGVQQERLLKGLDDIGLTLDHAGELAAFEARQKAAQPWLYEALSL